MEKGINEAVYVLNKAFSRNNHISSGLRKRCLANIYFRYGLNYAVMQDFKKSREALLKAVSNKPYSLRGFIFWGGMLVVPKLFYKFMLYLRSDKYYLIPKSFREQK